MFGVGYYKIFDEIILNSTYNNLKKFIQIIRFSNAIDELEILILLNGFENQWILFKKYSKI